MNIQHPLPMTALRARMIADMSARNLGPASQASHLRACKRFAAWLARSPDTATANEVKGFQQHLIESSVSICTRNQTMTGVKFLFRVTLRRHDLVAEIFHLREPGKVPLVLSKQKRYRVYLKVVHTIGADQCHRRTGIRAGPGRFIVNRIVRPRMACSCCETILQAPMPSRPIERGRPGPGLLAHVLVSKYADYLPLYRQSQIYERDGIDLDRSTMANWVGKSTALLEPLADAIGKQVRQGQTLFADDTPVKLLSPGNKRTKTARVWAYVRDERPWNGIAPPGTSSQLIERENILSVIYQNTKVGCMPMAMLASMDCLEMPKPQRLPAWLISVVSSLTCSNRKAQLLLKRQSNALPPSTALRKWREAVPPQNGSLFARKKPDRSLMIWRHGYMRSCPKSPASRHWPEQSVIR